MRLRHSQPLTAAAIPVPAAGNIVLRSGLGGGGVNSSEVVGLRDRVAIIRTLIFYLSKNNQIINDEFVVGFQIMLGCILSIEYLVRMLEFLHSCVVILAANKKREIGEWMAL